MEGGSSATDGVFGSVNSIISSLMKRREGRRSDESTNLQSALPSTSNIVAVPLNTQGNNFAFKASTSRNRKDENGSTVRLSPMEIPPILTHFFSICPAQTLAVARQVCSQWLNLSLSGWRTTSQIELQFKRLLEDNDVEVMFANKIAPLSEFLEYVENPVNQCSSFPYHRIKLDNWLFAPINGVLETFWKHIGSHLTSLELNNCYFAKVDAFRKVIFQKCPLLRNLIVVIPSFNSVGIYPPSMEPEDFQDPVYGEHVHMKYLSIKMIAPVSKKRFPISWTELLSHFQSLTTIKVSFERNNPSIWYTCQEEYDSLLHAIQLVRGHNNGTKLPIKSLYFDPSLEMSPGPFALAKFSLSRELSLPLSSLQIQLYVFASTVSNNDITDILQFHAGTLEEIIVIGSHFMDKNLFPLVISCEVKLCKLEKLRIVDAVHESTGILKRCPNLKELSIEVVLPVAKVTFETWRMGPLGINLGNLVKLNLGNSIVDLLELITLMKCIPKLEKLEMVLDDDMFAAVCGKWNLIKEFFARGRYLSDKGITGMSSTEFEGLGRKRIGKRTPNITNLKGLAIFSYDSRVLTEKSVFHGFLHLPNLRRISSCSRLPPVRFGTKAMKVLRRRNIEFLCDN